MVQIPGLTPNQLVPWNQIPQGINLNTPRNYGAAGGLQRYNPQAAQVDPRYANGGPQVNTGIAKGGGGVSQNWGGPAGSTASNAMRGGQAGAASTQGSAGGTQPSALRSGGSLFPQSPLTNLFAPQQSQSRYPIHSQTGNPIVPGYTDISGRPINGRPAGTEPVFSDRGVFTGNWQMAGSPQSTRPPAQPAAWTAAGRQLASQGGGAAGGGSATTGGTNASLGGGIQGGNISNNDLGYASWLIGGSGQMPMGMAEDAQREVRQTSQDLARQEAETAALDINRRGAYEQSRMDLARQTAEAESALGYGGLAARLYELMNNRSQAMEGYGYDLLSSVI